MYQLQGPEDVLKMGIEEYNKECRGIVMRYSGEWVVSMEYIWTYNTVWDIYISFDILFVMKDYIGKSFFS